MAGLDRPRLILVVDQLEELFTLGCDPAGRPGFLTALDSLATRAGGAEHDRAAEADVSPAA